MKKLLILLLCLGISGCAKLASEVYKDPNLLPFVIVMSPIAGVYHAAVAIHDIDNALTLQTKDYVQRTSCLKPYHPTSADIDETLFIMSEPMKCVSSKPDVLFEQNRVYYLSKLNSPLGKKLRDDEFAGYARTCTPVENQKDRFSCSQGQPFVIDTDAYLNTSDFRLLDPDNLRLHRDTNFPWMELFEYDKDCDTPLINLETNRKILFGLFDDRYHKAYAKGRACQFVVIQTK